MRRGEKKFEPEIIFEALTRHQIRFIVIGGFAGLAHEVGWQTFDVDTVIDPAEDNLERLLAALLELEAVYNTLHWPPIRPELHRLRDYTGPQLFRTKHGRLDVLKEAGGETYESLTKDAISLRLGAIEVACASLPALVRMKRAADRPKDRKVLPRLLEALRARGEEA